MADLTYRQGEGQIKTFTGTAPTARSDGTPLPAGEVDSFNLYVNYDGNIEKISGVELIDDSNTPEWDGSFTKPVEIDAIGVGTYSYHMTTVDTGGRESLPSNTVTMEVLPTLMQPNPPTIS